MRIITLFALLGGLFTSLTADEVLRTSVKFVKLGKELEVKVRFENISDRPVRVYFIENPIFNSFQSAFTVVHKDGTKSFIAEEPQPHGYVVTESDFHLIAPCHSKTFKQKIGNVTLGSGSNPAGIEWEYSNTITKWEGGIETLDGKTEALFGGKEIPYIWTGRIKAAAKIKPH